MSDAPIAPKGLLSTQVEDFLRETPHELDEELSHRLGFSVYVFADGRALLVAVGGGALFDSREQLVAFVNQAPGYSSRRHWRDLLPQGEGFSAAVPELLRQLPALLGVDGALLNQTEESLRHVDKALRRMGRQQVMTPDVFPAIVAYVGEVLRRAVGGQWRMREGPAGWEPWIVDADGRFCAILGIAKDIQERGRAVSLRAFVNAKLHGRGFSD